MASAVNYPLVDLYTGELTDGVITPYSSQEFKMCALDVVNSVINLAYMDPEKAMELEFHTEYFIRNSKEVLERLNDKDSSRSISKDTREGSFTSVAGSIGDIA